MAVLISEDRRRFGGGAAAPLEYDRLLKRS